MRKIFAVILFLLLFLTLQAVANLQHITQQGVFLNGYDWQGLSRGEKGYFIERAQWI